MAKPLLFFLFCFTFAVTSLARLPRRGPASTPSCKTLANHRETVKDGTDCKTTQGIRFLRTREGWQDLGPQGKIWLDPIANDVNQPQAVEFCHESTLPSKEEYLIAEGHGFREILDEMNYFFYWTRSKVVGKNAFGFSASAGTVSVMKQENYAPYVAARCLQAPR